MFEFLVLVMGALPFFVGLYALRRIKRSDDEGSDDQPPPPDPEPPLPFLPTSPELRHVQRPIRRTDLSPVPSARSRRPVRSGVSLR